MKMTAAASAHIAIINFFIGDTPLLIYVIICLPKDVVYIIIGIIIPNINREITDFGSFLKHLRNPVINSRKVHLRYTLS